MNTTELMGKEEFNKYWKMSRKMKAYVEILSSSGDSEEKQIVAKGLNKMLDECLEDEWLNDLTGIYRHSKEGDEYNIAAVYSFVEQFTAIFQSPDKMMNEREKKEQPKQNGMNKSIYIQPGNINHYKALCKMAEESGTSFSEIINEAIRQAYYQMRTHTWISPGAYLAIANGQLEALECLRSRDDGVDLYLKTDAPKYTFTDMGLDKTFKNMSKGTAYAIGGVLLRHAEEPQETPDIPESLH